MIDVRDVPAPTLPRRRADADKQRLQALVAATAPSPASARRRLLVVGGIVAALLTGGTAATAYSLLRPQGATDQASARCYAQATNDLNDDDFRGTTITIVRPLGQPSVDTPPAAVTTCASLWQAGLLTPAGYSAETLPPDGLLRQLQPAPPLVGCVLPSGQAAVLPGDNTLCQRLGLPLFVEH